MSDMNPMAVGPATGRRWLTTPSTARDVSLLTAAVAAVYLLTGDHPPLGSSTRYPEACREMAEAKTWLVPLLGHVPYLEKPPLTYWLGTASQRVFGGGDLAAQLPAALAAWVSLIATWAIGSRWKGPVFGLVAALLLLGSGMFLGMASTLTTDPLLAACLACAWWGFHAWELKDRQGPGIWGFWAAIGIGGLTKGLIALVLPGCAIGAYALLLGGWREPFRLLWAMHPLRGLGVAVGISLPWSLWLWQHDWRMLWFFHVWIQFQGLYSDQVNHAGRWWYYGPVMLGMLAPYTLLAVPLLVRSWWRIGQERIAVLRGLTPAATTAPVDRSRLLFTAIALAPLAFLSVSASKLGTYPLPLLPAFILLFAEACGDHQKTPRWMTALLAGQALLILLVLTLAPLVLAGLHEAAEEGVTLQLGSRTIPVASEEDLHRVDWSYLPWAVLALACLVLALVGSVVQALRGRLVVGMLAMSLGFVLAAACVLPRAHQAIRDLDGARLTTVIHRDGTATDPVLIQEACVHDYELHRGLGRRAILVDNARELGFGHFTEVHGPEVPPPKPGQPLADPYLVKGETLPGNPWLWTFNQVLDRWHGPERIWVLCEDYYLNMLRKGGLDPVVVDRARGTLLLSNRGPSHLKPEEMKDLERRP